MEKKNERETEEYLYRLNGTRKEKKKISRSDYKCLRPYEMRKHDWHHLTQKQAVFSE